MPSSVVLMPVWIAPLVAGLVTMALLVQLLKRTASLPLDHPNERSLHTQPTPRIGGLALFPGAVGGCLAVGIEDTGTLLLLVLAGILFLMSALDDRRGLPVLLRLGTHLGVALCLAFVLLGASPLALLPALAVAWMTNLYNFMDGSNGLAGGMAVVGFTSFGIAAGDSPLGFALAGAALGFLVFNFDPAKVFLGDAGSIPLGFLAGGMGLMGAVRGEWPWWFPLLVFSAFIVDATITLVQRLMRREKIWHAHRDHYYQRLVRMGCSHRQLAQMAYALMAACGLSALALLYVSHVMQMVGLAAWIFIYCGLMRVINRRWNDFNRQTGARA